MSARSRPSHRSAPICDEAPLLRIEPLDIDTHAIPAREEKGEGAHRHHDFAYLVVALEAQAFVAQLDEVHTVRWARLEELAQSANARTRRLAHKALRLLNA